MSIVDLHCTTSSPEKNISNSWAKCIRVGQTLKKIRGAEVVEWSRALHHGTGGPRFKSRTRQLFFQDSKNNLQVHTSSCQPEKGNAHERTKSGIGPSGT